MEKSDFNNLIITPPTQVFTMKWEISSLLPCSDSNMGLDISKAVLILWLCVKECISKHCEVCSISSKLCCGSSCLTVQQEELCKDCEIWYYKTVTWLHIHQHAPIIMVKKKSCLGVDLKAYFIFQFGVLFTKPFQVNCVNYCQKFS